MVKRPFWIRQINVLWQEASVIWLSGVRRSGKTCLCQSLDNVEYFDCELPSVRRELADPEFFLQRLAPASRIIIDEIHRLPNPSEFLKIAADHFPGVRVIATGSSTLGASAKFRDTLTGRKRDLRLVPLLAEEAALFGPADLDHRMLAGGLPPLFMAERPLPHSYTGWLDDYWARDMTTLFRVHLKPSFDRFVELLLTRSGGLFEASAYAAECEANRQTLANYLALLESTYVVTVVRPFHSQLSAEITHMPRVYAFDTGFIACFSGIEKLRSEDRGRLWEHLVLNEITGWLQGGELRYWRDKTGHEVDFILRRPDGSVDTVECKWNADSFDGGNLALFRRKYPHGANYVVAANINRPFARRFGDIPVTFTSLDRIGATAAGAPAFPGGTSAPRIP